ncbi:MAG: pyridoxamine 5'-phosphate oxidase family protein [Streptosporangiaceae bacterium]
MTLSAAESGFLDTHYSAAMITIGDGGLPKAVRVGVALVEGKLCSSGTQDRVRTRRLRRDPRCTLFVFDPGFAWLTLETTVTILDGPDAATLNLALFRVMQNRPSGPLSWFGGELDEASFLRTMTEEGRLIYEFRVHRSYGLT